MAVEISRRSGVSTSWIPVSADLDVIGPVENRLQGPAIDQHRIAAQQEFTDALLERFQFVHLDVLVTAQAEVHPFLQVPDPGQDLVPHFIGFNIEKRHQCRLVVALEVGIVEFRVPRVVPVKAEFRRRPQVTEIDDGYRLVIDDKTDGHLGPSLCIPGRHHRQFRRLFLEGITQLCVEHALVGRVTREPAGGYRD